MLLIVEKNDTNMYSNTKKSFNFEKYLKLTQNFFQSNCF